MILTVTLNPALDQTLLINGLKTHDTNRIQEIQTDAGGKGINLSRIASELGTATTATGFLGGSTGAAIRHVMKCQHVIDECIETESETRTNYNIESGDGPPTTLNAKGNQISEQEWLILIAKVTELASHSTWITLGGSLPPGVPENAFGILGDIAKNCGAKIVLDADGAAMQAGLVAFPDFIKPNVREAERLLNRQLFGSRDAIIQAAKDLYGQNNQPKSPEPIVVISRGAEGAIMCCGQGTFETPSLPITPKSTIGSGDSMIGGMLHAILKGHDLPTALRYGNAAGAATATSDGAEIGRLHDILEFFEKTTVREIN
ncbi:MAG: 1-phosphofructokinase family hexose kinase [Fimbriimonadaceae bacterium]